MLGAGKACPITCPSRTLLYKSTIMAHPSVLPARRFSLYTSEPRSDTHRLSDSTRPHLHQTESRVPQRRSSSPHHTSRPRTAATCSVQSGASPPRSRTAAATSGSRSRPRAPSRPFLRSGDPSSGVPTVRAGTRAHDGRSLREHHSTRWSPSPPGLISSPSIRSCRAPSISS